MNEFIKKLIERLEENGQKMCEAKSSVPFGKHSSANHRYYKAISVKKAIFIINQLAEEYNECIKSSCSNCETYDNEKHYCPKWCDVIKGTVAEIEENKGGGVMKELIEKIVKRLEKAKFDGNYTEAIWHRHGINKAIDIIHEEAKAYNESVKGDLISRNLLMEALNKSDRDARTDADIQGYCDGWNDVVEIINEQPTAYNDGWIPVSSGKLPDESMRTDDSRIVTVETTEVLENGKIVTFIEDYSLETKEFITPYKVIAWRNRPQPYQPKGE